ncbi:MAG: Transaldolase [Phycisphaerae bacterium]|nr:Transaldolase [Phycisphaerae bacterium]
MHLDLADHLAGFLAELVAEVFSPRFEQLAGHFPSHPRWRQMRDAGTELWLDTGDVLEIGRRWTREFSAVTTNNSLLNREVQKGQYDRLIPRAAALIRGRAGRHVGDRERELLVTYALNARHGLKLVEAFDARVSVEEHTDLAADTPGAVEYGRNIYAICPQRFIVKIPLTPQGLVAARRCHDAGVPVNFTLGFSARQNYLIARFAKPDFCNVFLGRLNSFVADNKLGDGEQVGEKATLASQRAVRGLRDSHRLTTRQIAASIRTGRQVADLAGVDVHTIPVGAYDQFLKLDVEVADRTGDDPQVKLADGVKPSDCALDTLWEVPDKLVTACDALDQRDPADLTGADLVKVLADHGVGNLLIDWTDEQIELSRREGKIPKMKNWAPLLADGTVGLDALMNLAGLNAFTADQDAMDEKVRSVLAGMKSAG